MLEKKLPKLDLNVCSNIQAGITSIYRINRTDKSFLDLVKNDSLLSEAYFITHSNDNTSNSVSYYDTYGKLILKSNNSINKLIFLPLGFDIEYSHSNIDSPILKEYINLNVLF